MSKTSFQKLESLEPRQLLSGGPFEVDNPIPVVHPLEANPAAEVRLITRDSYMPSMPILVRVQVADTTGKVDRGIWDSIVTLTSTNPNVSLSTNEVQLINGMGSSLVTVSGNEPLGLMAAWGESAVQKELAVLDEAQILEASGTLLGTETNWQGIVRVTGDVQVPENHTLNIAAGTLVLIDGVEATPKETFGSTIQVQGTLNARGTELRPITLTAADSSRPWGAIEVAGGTANLTHTIITRAGRSPRAGHTRSGAALRLSDAGSISLVDSSVTDISGKTMWSTSGDVIMVNSLLSRAVMGPEINETSLDFRDSWIIDMAGRFHHEGTVDDNDGIYLRSQEDGQRVHLQGGVVAGVQDDGIDTLGSTALIEDFIVRDADDKAISAFDGEVTIRRGLLVNSGIGIETKGAGDSTPHTIVDRTTIANVEIGVFAKDKDSPDPDVVITYDITNSIIHVKPDGDPLKTDYDPVDLHINYSAVMEPWDHSGSGVGLITEDVEFVGLGHNNYRLMSSSPAIDKGDPSSDPDPDGTRADLGYFFVDQSVDAPPDPNGDGAVDARDIDLLCQAIHGAAHHLDLDGDGQLTYDDVLYLVRRVLGTNLGDANLDGVFNSSDLVQVFQAGQYEDNIAGNSGWATGDWNCDGEFSTGDLVAAFQAGAYTAASAPRQLDSRAVSSAVQAALRDLDQGRRR